MSLTTQQKFLAMRSLCDATQIRIDLNGNFYVRLPGVERARRGMLSSLGAHADCPIKAIDQTWEQITSLTSYETIVVDAMKSQRKEYRWDGFMWKQLELANKGPDQ